MKLRKIFRKFWSCIRSSKSTSKLNKEVSFNRTISSNSIESHRNESLVHQTVESVEVQYQILNLDCLVNIFERNMSILEMIKLRTVCRSWNAAVCEVLRKKNTLKVFPGRKLLTNINRLPIRYEEQKSHPVLRISERPEHEDLVLLGVCNERNVASFVFFLHNRMPSITKLVLVLEVSSVFIFSEDEESDSDPQVPYQNSVFWQLWNWLESILDAVPNMETLFLSLVHVDERKNHSFYEMPIIRSFGEYTSIDRHKALEVMHRSFQKRPKRLRELLLSQKHSLFLSNDTPDYIDDLLEGLESLSCRNLPTNIKPKPSIKKLSVDRWSKSYSNIFPNVETLEEGSRELFSKKSVIEDIEAKFMPNLKHLEFREKLWLDSVKIMSKLNSLPKLEQLTCEKVIVPSEFAPILTKHYNRTITHLNLTGEIYKVPEFLQNELPKILKAFVSLKQLTIRYDREEKERYFKDVCFKELLRSLPKGINVKLIEVNKCLERFRYMGRFRQTLQQNYIDKNTAIIANCSCRGLRNHPFDQ